MNQIGKGARVCQVQEFFLIDSSALLSVPVFIHSAWERLWTLAIIDKSCELLFFCRILKVAVAVVARQICVRQVENSICVLQINLTACCKKAITLVDILLFGSSVIDDSEA
uniref:Uncharacterized protein n=1 Tax=Syphacia muris TaxID=451379 RepID=A0A0N5ATR7_9BILA